MFIANHLNDLVIDRNLLNPNFESYKLSLESLPISQISLEFHLDLPRLDANLYSYQHLKVFGLTNCLTVDPWNLDHVWFVDEKWNVMKSVPSSTLGLTMDKPRRAYRIPDPGNRRNGIRNRVAVGLHFTDEEWAVLNDGAGRLLILKSGVRNEESIWKECYKDYPLGKDVYSRLLHSQKYTNASGDLSCIDVLLVHVQEEDSVSVVETGKDVSGGSGKTGKDVSDGSVKTGKDVSDASGKTGKDVSGGSGGKDVSGGSGKTGKDVSCGSGGEHGWKNPFGYEPTRTRVTRLSWLTFVSENEIEFHLTRTRTLDGTSCPDYAVVSKDARTLVLCCERAFEFGYDSLLPLVTGKVVEGGRGGEGGAGEKNGDRRPLYAWTQKGGEITLSFQMPPGTVKRNLDVCIGIDSLRVTTAATEGKATEEMTGTFVGGEDERDRVKRIRDRVNRIHDRVVNRIHDLNRVEKKDVEGEEDRVVLLVDGKLSGKVDIGECAWTVDDRFLLEIYLTKVDPEEEWKEVLVGDEYDERGQRVYDPEQIEQINRALEPYTVTDNEISNEIPDRNKPFNVQQLEECDDELSSSSDDGYAVWSYDGDTHQIVQQVNLSFRQWLFSGLAYTDNHQQSLASSSMKKKKKRPNNHSTPHPYPAICLRHDVDAILLQLDFQPPTKKRETSSPLTFLLPPPFPVADANRRPQTTTTTTTTTTDIFSAEDDIVGEGRTNDEKGRLPFAATVAADVVVAEDSAWSNDDDDDAGEEKERPDSEKGGGRKYKGAKDINTIVEGDEGKISGDHLKMADRSEYEKSTAALAANSTMSSSSWKHVSTFDALGYVQASKRQRKFTVFAPDLNFTAIVDRLKHAFVYRKPDDRYDGEADACSGVGRTMAVVVGGDEAGAYEEECGGMSWGDGGRRGGGGGTVVTSLLRNRKTGRVVGSVAKQQVVSLETGDEIEGAAASNKRLVLLTRNCLYAIRINSD